MAALLHSESKRLCSWWWDSHISPKNSKWLQDNLTDMDAKVKAMIKLINEDADSFARRAEMYYKKRPELMKLVEEFYRAYRALAERYDHATGELRQAHRTMAEAFPDQFHFKLNDDIPSSSEPQSPLTPFQIRTFFYLDDMNKESDVGFSKKGLKQLNDMFQAVEHISQDSKLGDSDLKREAGPSIFRDENHNLKAAGDSEYETGGKTEADILRLKEALAKMKAERDGVLAQYKESLEKLCNLEKELGLAGKDAERLSKLVQKSGCEVEALKESFRQVVAERDQNLGQYNESFERIATLETAVAEFKESSTKLSCKASTAEAESRNLKEELSRAEAENNVAFAQYEGCLEKIFSLENMLLLVEENAKMLSLENERAQNQIKVLKDDVSRLKDEKQDVYLLSQECLNTIYVLQRELRQAKEDVERLSGEVLMESAKIKFAEDQCASLQELNQSFKLEADDLMQRIAAKDQQLSVKEHEFTKLVNSLHNEHAGFLQAEAALLSLQNLHFQSQEEQTTLALELRNGLQMLKDLEEEIKDLREGNRELNDLKSTSSATQKNMEAEILSLREINAKLEAEVMHQIEKNDVLQQQAHRLKQEIEDLHTKYCDILHQIKSSGIDPNCIGSSIKDLNEENSRLKQTSTSERTEKEVLLKRLAYMQLLLQRTASLESSLSGVNTELEWSKEKVKSLQDSCSVLSGDKATLVGEKSALLSQLHMVTESMQKLLEKNASLDTSLLSANTELEGLRAKSHSLEDFCQLLNNERSNLLTEKRSLVSQLEYVEKKLENLEARFTKLEDKYAFVEKEKESTLSQVEELRISLGVERKERVSLVLTSQTWLSGLEDRIENLQQENKSRKKDFEEQLEKAVNAQVEIFIMQKLMQDMEQKNYSLIVESQKHVDTARYSEKIISELESENMMKQLEAEFLLDRMAKLRSGICLVLKAFEIDHLSEPEPENLLSVVLENLKVVKRNFSEIRDENHKLLVENEVLITLIQQLNSEGLKLASCKEALDQQFSLLNQKNVLLEQEYASLRAHSRQLEILVGEKERGQETLMVELGDLNSKQAELQREYHLLQNQQVSTIKDSRHLQGKLMVLQHEKVMLEEENSSLTTEALSLSNLCVIFRGYGAEKATELDRVAQDMRELLKAYQDLEKEAEEFWKKLTGKEIENLLLKELILSSEELNKELSDCNDQLICQLQSEKEIVNQKETELLEAKLKIKATEDDNAEMLRVLEALQKQCEGLDITRGGLERQVLKLHEDKEHQGKEIRRLWEDNERLESEIDELGGEIEDYKIREVILSSELRERSSEIELWEAEAASFYFDLQISSLREVLLENKVTELTGRCAGFEDANCERSQEVERINHQKSIMQEEINKLKTRLDAYVPTVAFLKEHISSLEKNPILQPSLQPDGSLVPENETFKVHDIKEPKSLGSREEQSLSAQDTLSALQELQGRIKAIESALVEGMTRVSKQEQMKSNSKLDAALKQIEELRSKLHLQPDRSSCSSGIKTGSPPAKSSDSSVPIDQSSEIRNGSDMKDIPLDHVSDSSLSSNRRRGSGRLDDQMLELWETEERDSGCDSTPQQKQTQKSELRRNGSVNYQKHEIREESSNMGSSQMSKDLGVDTMVTTKTLTESNHGGNSKRVILERLASDAQLLMNLRISLKDSRKKVETNRRSKKSSRAFEYERLRAQLEEVEHSVSELVEMNAELAKIANANHNYLGAEVASFHLLEAEQARRKKLSEQAKRESERIARLQLETQRIQYILLNMEDEKDKNVADYSSTINQGKSRSRTGIILSKFIYSRGNRSPRKQKMPRFCGCFKHTRREI